MNGEKYSDILDKNISSTVRSLNLHLNKWLYSKHICIWYVYVHTCVYISVYVCVCWNTNTSYNPQRKTSFKHFPPSPLSPSLSLSLRALSNLCPSSIEYCPSLLNSIKMLVANDRMFYGCSQMLISLWKLRVRVRFYVIIWNDANVCSLNEIYSD